MPTAVERTAPVLAGLLLFAGLSTLSLPGLSSFVSEFMVLAGTFTRHPVHAVVSTLAIVLAALYILIMYQRTMTGAVRPERPVRVRDVTFRERLAMAPLVLLIVVLGVFQADARRHRARGVRSDAARRSHRSAAADHRGRRPLMSPIPVEITAPNLEYRLLLPVLLIFAGACVGVLVEAILSRSHRNTVQLVVTFAFRGPLISTVLNWRTQDEAITAVGSIAIDGPTYFMWTILLVFSAASFLLFAERKVENGVSASRHRPQPFQARSPNGRRSRPGWNTQSVYPLALFALSGMMLFPASSDLITMFVALEILSLPLYLLCGLARRRRLLSQESSLKYFLLGALSSAFFLYGGLLGMDTPDHLRPERYRRGGADQPSAAGPVAGRCRIDRHGAVVQVRCGALPLWTPDVYGRLPRRSQRSWRPAQRSQPSALCSACSMSARRRSVGLATADGRRRRGHHGGRVCPRHNSDRCQEDARAYSSIAHAGFI